MHSAVQWITHYGYAGIFSLLALGIVGLPIPDETLLVFVGFLIFRGKLHTVPAFVSAFSGAVCGITLSYGLGRGFGTYLVPRWGRSLRLSRERLERVQDWFRRSGRWVLVFGYYVPGVRHFTAYVAGASDLPFRAFAVFAYAGGLVWSLTFIGFGYFLGEGWRGGIIQLERGLRIIAGTAVAGILLYLWLRRGKARAAS